MQCRVQWNWDDLHCKWRNCIGLRVGEPAGTRPRGHPSEGEDPFSFFSLPFFKKNFILLCWSIIALYLGAHLQLLWACKFWVPLSNLSWACKVWGTPHQWSENFARFARNFKQLQSCMWLLIFHDLDFAHVFAKIFHQILWLLNSTIGLLKSWLTSLLKTI